MSIYLLICVGAAYHRIPHEWPHEVSKLFTFLGIAFPTLGSSIAGIRFFGDFERFAAISQVTAEKLDDVQARIDLMISGPESAISFGGVAEIIHVIDEIVVEEIESWQAVFGGKHIALPA